MIAKISRGWRAEGLIHYLMGPGRFNEHTGQRVVASWDGAPETHQPAQAADGSFNVQDLVEGLSAPAVAAGVGLREPVVKQGKRMPQGPVWHCSLRNSPEDPVLTDEQWARVVEDLMDRTGIARRGDLDGCRWVAIRHADDHVHVAAVLVRQESGRKVSPSFDKTRSREVCRAWEEELGLMPTAGADRSSVTGPTQSELERALAHGKEESSREWLRRMARVAAVQARDPQGFVAALRTLGVRVRPRYAGAEPGSQAAGAEGDETREQMIGYSLAADWHTTKERQPVWFSGRTLAPDLSLPNLQRRWASAPTPAPLPAPDEVRHRAAVSPQERADAVDDAVSAMNHATTALGAARETGRSDEAGPDEGTGRGGRDADGIAHAAGDMLTAIGITCGRQDETQTVRRQAGDDLDRALRVPGKVLPSRWSPVASSLRQAAWRLARVRTVGRHGEGDATRLVLALAALVAEIAALREQQARLAQAHAARRSCTALMGSTPGARAPTGGSGPGAVRTQRPSARPSQRPPQPTTGPGHGPEGQKVNPTRGRSR